MATRKTRSTKTKAADEAMADYRHDEAKRKNNPPAKITAEARCEVIDPRGNEVMKVHKLN